jgi:hypothetical protein
MQEKDSCDWSAEGWMICTWKGSSNSVGCKVALEAAVAVAAVVAAVDKTARRHWQQESQQQQQQQLRCCGHSSISSRSS